MHRYLGEVDPMHWLLTLFHYPNPKPLATSDAVVAATETLRGNTRICIVFVESSEILRSFTALKVVLWSCNLRCGFREK